MIKNDNQLARAESQLREIERQIAELATRHSTHDLRFWASPLEEEAAKVRAEMDEYRQLSQLTLEQAIQGPLRTGMLLENTGELLAKLRIAAGLTQAQLAEQLGWDQPNISRFESANYSGQTLEKISEYLDGLGVWLHVQPSLSEKPLNINFHASEQSRFYSVVAEDAIDTFAAALQSGGDPIETDSPMSPVGSLSWVTGRKTTTGTYFQPHFRVSLDPTDSMEAATTP